MGRSTDAGKWSEKGEATLEMETKQTFWDSACQASSCIPVPSGLPLGIVDTLPPSAPQLEAPGGQRSIRDNLTSLSLGFPICKMEILMLSPP